MSSVDCDRDCDRDRKPLHLAVIGDPVAHSRSPAMHNAALKKCRIRADYTAMQVKKSGLPRVIRLLREGCLDGCNITIPHKQTILKYLDDLTPEARCIGAVNTVYRHGAKIIGHNTDGAGFLLALEKFAHFSPRGMNCVIIGAGGAALAIAHALATSNAATLTLINRTPANAHQICRSVRQHQKRIRLGWAPLRQLVSSGKDARTALTQANLVINTTALGMKGNPWPDLSWLRCLKSGALVSDIVYNPRKTPLLAAAKKLGLKIHEGTGMLLYQGALAFEKFTGRKAPVAAMQRALLKSL